MTEGNTNAYPMVISQDDFSQGLSKRELFAAMAAPLFKEHASNGMPHEEIAKYCVGFADALIKELNK